MSEITQRPECTHLLFGEGAEFTGEWRRASAKGAGSPFCRGY